MIVKKHNGKVYGAEFSNAERKAMELEVGRMIAEANEKNAANFDALVLCTFPIFASHCHD